MTVIAVDLAGDVDHPAFVAFAVALRISNCMAGTVNTLVRFWAITISSSRCTATNILRAALPAPIFHAVAVSCRLCMSAAD
jgi:hypothetical protein